jgi:hypothetical protein
MRSIIRFTAALALCLGTMVMPSSAAFVAIPQPDASYISTTTLLPISAADQSNVNSLTDGIFTATFSTPLQVFTNPGAFPFTWNTPPATENANPTVLLTSGFSSVTLLTIAFSQPVSQFGLEAQPDAFDIDFSVTANFYDGALNVGSINLSPSGDAGALLFAASTSGKFTSFDITAIPLTLPANDVDFAIAELRYTLAPTSVPEPGTWMAMAGGLSLLGFRKLLKRG